MKIKKVSLRSQRKATNPWIFTKMVRHPNPRPKAGTIVAVYDKQDTFVGYAFYHPKQTIALRIISENINEPVTKEYIYLKLRRAKELRENILNIQSNSYRLIHGEADGLSGVVIDKFANLFIIEPYSAGAKTIGEWLAWALRKLYPKHNVAFRADARTEQREGVSFSELSKKYPYPKSIVIEENSLKLLVDFKVGHKTGYFLDQRENRAFIASLAKDKNVADLFSYTGGFGLNCLKKGAKKVISVDLDEKATAVAKKNARLNGLPYAEGQYKIVHKDAFDFLRELNEEMDIIIVDPSKFVANRAEYSVAIKKYADINKLAMQKVKNGGILATFSCSGAVHLDKFLSVLYRSAEETGKVLQIFKISGAGGDHPILSRFPEGSYLKAVFARVFDV